jgi:hypothetical protein
MMFLISTWVMCIFTIGISIRGIMMGARDGDDIQEMGNLWL